MVDGWNRTRIRDIGKKEKRKDTPRKKEQRMVTDSGTKGWELGWGKNNWNTKKQAIKKG